jgi:hypothetical protein
MTDLTPPAAAPSESPFPPHNELADWIVAVLRGQTSGIEEARTVSEEQLREIVLATLDLHGAYELGWPGMRTV